MAQLYIERNGRDTRPVAVDHPLPVSIEVSTDQTGGIVTAGRMKKIQTFIVRPADTTAYAANDSVTSSTTAALAPLVMFPGVARYDGGSGYIVRATIGSSNKSNTATYRLWLFTVPVALVADNAAFVITPVHVDALAGYIDLGPMATEDTNSTASVAQDGSIRLPYLCDAGSMALYGILEIKLANTPTASEKLTITLLVDQN